MRIASCIAHSQLNPELGGDAGRTAAALPSSLLVGDPSAGSRYALCIYFARGSALASPGPVDSSRYFDVAVGRSSVCVVNDRGFTLGVSTWGNAKTRSFSNDPDQVHWAPAQLRD